MCLRRKSKRLLSRPDVDHLVGHPNAVTTEDREQQGPRRPEVCVFHSADECLVHEALGRLLRGVECGTEVQNGVSRVFRAARGMLKSSDGL